MLNAISKSREGYSGFRGDRKLIGKTLNPIKPIVKRSI